MPFPQLYERDATFIDGHAWVMPTKERTPQQRDAIFRLLKFLADNDYHWARTGHLPSFKQVIESERFNALPHRSELARLSSIGMPLPSAVQRQFPVQDIIGEEMAAAVAGHKPVDAALADAEDRVNELLFHLL
jgi:multiple sugar transport system substrate-binding protein